MTKKKEIAAAPTAEPVISSIKGFDRNLSCRGFAFEIGKTYSVSSPIKTCQNGFHACPTDEHPLSVEFYPPASSRYFEVVQSGETSKAETKLASAKITIGVEISLTDLAQRAVKWVFDRADWKNGSVATAPNEGATASGDAGAATASGYAGAATASGDAGAATASGYAGAATASGVRGAATASGYAGAATASGDAGAATASGYAGIVRGAAGCALFAVERADDMSVKSVACGIVGQNGIEPNVWYRAQDGKLIPADYQK